MTVIKDVLSSVKGASETARTALQMRDEVKLSSALAEVHEKLTGAQAALLDLQQQHYEMLDENRKLREAQNREARFDRYILERTERGGFVLRLDPSKSPDGEISHAICPNCREDGLISYMGEDEYGLSCARCKYYASKKAKPPRFKKGNRVIPPSYL